MDERAIAIAFAPEVRLHSSEQYFPAHVQWYLSRCVLKLRTSDLASDPIVLPEISSIRELLSVQCQYHGGSHGSLGALDLPKSTSLYVTPLSSDTYAGEPDKLDQIPLYVNVVYKTPPTHDPLVLDLQYFFFYAYNGPLLWYLPSAGIHEGDWEHVTIRVRIPQPPGLISDASIVGVFFAAHGREGRWRMTCIGRESCPPGRTTNSLSTQPPPLPPTECTTFRGAPPIAQPLTTEDDLTGDWYSLNRDGHVVVYASKFVHASYPFAGRQRRFVPLGMIDDETDAAGLSWRCYQNLVVLGHVGAARDADVQYQLAAEKEQEQEPSAVDEDRSTRWAWYTGRWGRYAANMLESSGPFGPALKAYFRSGDPDPPPEVVAVTATTTTTSTSTTTTTTSAQQ